LLNMRRFDQKNGETQRIEEDWSTCY
jgi:hypothetical protein